MALEISEIVGWLDNIVAIVNKASAIAKAVPKGGEAVLAAVNELIDAAQDFAAEIAADIED